MGQTAQVENPVQTREKILSTAARMFSAQGYDNTSLAQVAREANVSKALIFWHFDNKEKLFEAALHRTLEPFFIDLADFEVLDERARIERLIDAFFEFIRENVYSVRFLLSLILRSQKHPDESMGRVSELYGMFRGLLASTIESGRRNGIFREDVLPELDSSVILATLDGILIERFLNNEPTQEPSELLGHVKRRLLDRLLA